jgi:hypothetical protein
MDTALKRHWLAILPFLSVGDRRRLDDILGSDPAQGRRGEERPRARK